MVPEPIGLNPGAVAASAGDRLLGFSVPGYDARGRVVRLCGTLDAILGAHDYPEPLARLLAEALVLAALIGSTLRPDEGQMTMQAQSKGGPVDLMVCDYAGGALRGYLRVDAARQGEIAATATLPDIFGEGYLAITLDQTAAAERYQGIVPLEGDTLCHAAEAYFAGSEQIPTLIRAAVRRDGDDWIAGGMLVQYLPSGEIGGERLSVRADLPAWDHVRALAGTVQPAELTDPALALDTLVWRLFHEQEVRVQEPLPLSRGCRCSPDYITGVLRQMPEGDRADMRGDDGRIGVDCAFCALTFRIDA